MAFLNVFPELLHNHELVGNQLEVGLGTRGFLAETEGIGELLVLFEFFLLFFDVLMHFLAFLQTGFEASGILVEGTFLDTGKGLFKLFFKLFQVVFSLIALGLHLTADILLHSGGHVLEVLPLFFSDLGLLELVIFHGHAVAFVHLQALFDHVQAQ